jgi:hypothetical protein
MCAHNDCDEPLTPAGNGGTVRGQAPEPSPSNPRRFARRWSNVSSDDGGNNSWADSDLGMGAQHLNTAGTCNGKESEPRE